MQQHKPMSFIIIIGVNEFFSSLQWQLVGLPISFDRRILAISENMNQVLSSSHEEFLFLSKGLKYVYLTNLKFFFILSLPLGHLMVECPHLP